MPWTPEMVANSGYEKRIPDPRATRVSCHSNVEKGGGRGGPGLERWGTTIDTAAEPDRVFTVQSQLRRRTPGSPQKGHVCNRKHAPRLDPDDTSTQRP
jgi:hypothetical protein